MFALLPATAVANPAPVTDLAIAKAADRADAVPGDVVTWTVTVRNTGTVAVPIAAIAVDDPGVELAAAGAVPQDGVLAPGGELVSTGRTAITADACPVLANTATVRLVSPDVTALKSKKTAPVPVKSKKRPKKGAKPGRTPKAPQPPPAPVDANPANDTATATVNVTCPPPPPPADEAPAVVPPPPPPPAVVPVACPLPALRVGIVAPRRVRSGRPIRVAVTVHNASAAIGATDVVARYALPRGTALARTPRGARVLRGRSVVLRVPSLAPGASRTVWMVLRPTSGIVHRRGHRALARERCTGTRAALTVTQVQNSRPRKRVPRVTG